MLILVFAAAVAAAPESFVSTHLESLPNGMRPAAYAAHLVEESGPFSAQDRGVTGTFLNGLHVLGFIEHERRSMFVYFVPDQPKVCIVRDEHFSGRRSEAAENAGFRSCNAAFGLTPSPRAPRVQFRPGQ